MVLAELLQVASGGDRPGRTWLDGAKHPLPYDETDAQIRKANLKFLTSRASRAGSDTRDSPS